MRRFMATTSPSAREPSLTTRRYRTLLRTVGAAGAAGWLAACSSDDSDGANGYSVGARCSGTTAGPATLTRTRAIRADLDRLHTITFTGPAGTFRQITELTKPQRDLLAALSLDPPKKIIELTTTL